MSLNWTNLETNLEEQIIKEKILIPDPTSPHLPKGPCRLLRRGLGLWCVGYAFLLNNDLGQKKTLALSFTWIIILYKKVPM